MNFKYILLAPATLMAFGCTTLTAQSPQPVVAPGQAAKTPELPKRELTREILFQYLASEIAGQRGESGLAAEGMLDLARTTRDPRLAKRATEVALQSRREQQALAAAELWPDWRPQSAPLRAVIFPTIASGRTASRLAPLPAERAWPLLSSHVPINVGSRSTTRCWAF